MGGPGSGRKKGSGGGKTKKYVDPRVSAQKKANRAQDKAAKQMRSGTMKSAYQKKRK